MLRNTWLALCAAVLACAALAAACGSDPKPPAVDPNAGKVAPAPRPTAKKAARDGDENPSNVSIDDRVAKMCNLPEARFDFDSASVGESARSVLDKLAECFISGPGKGKRMNIVGHADPRGETEYNFALGQRRAASITGYLTKAGLEDARVEASSRGEIEATGTDEKGWARDRKVEILLAE